MEIPVIDFSCYSLNIESSTVELAELKKLSHVLVKAFESAGFVYLKNHGILTSQVKLVVKKFFACQ